MHNYFLKNHLSVHQVKAEAFDEVFIQILHFLIFFFGQFVDFSSFPVKIVEKAA